MVTERAPAKINLGLHVLRRRPDGDHAVETVLHRIGWADTVTAKAAGALSMTCSDPALPTDKDNLCLRAAHALREAFDVSAGARLHLDKQVPYGAGLGGGSSDAAATLRLLTRLWDLDADPDRLHAIAADLGADVPFFLEEAPAAVATGRGDALTPLTDAADRPYRLPYPALVLVPPVEVSTPEAYRWVTPDAADRPDLAALVRPGNLARWRAALTNDFEGPVAERHPSVAAARDWLGAQGADYVSLTGSGSGVYGLFEKVHAARAAREAAAARDERAHLTVPDASREHPENGR